MRVKRPNWDTGVDEWVDVPDAAGEAFLHYFVNTQAWEGDMEGISTKVRRLRLQIAEAHADQKKARTVAKPKAKKVA